MSETFIIQPTQNSFKYSITHLANDQVYNHVIKSKWYAEFWIESRIFRNVELVSILKHVLDKSDEFEFIFSEKKSANVLKVKKPSVSV